MWARRLLGPILALGSLLSVLTLLDVVDVEYYPMIHRVTVDRVFDLGLNPSLILLFLSFLVVVLLLLEWRPLGVLLPITASLGLYPLLGLRVSSSLLTLLLTAFTLVRFRCVQDFCLWLLTLMAGLEGLALIHWLLLPLGLCSPLKPIAELEMSLFYVAAHAAPILALMVLFMWIIRPLLNHLGIPRLLSRCMASASDSDEGGISLNPHLILALAVGLSILAAIYPYSPGINPTFKPVGVDVRWYVPWMEGVYRDPPSALRVAGGSRPLLLLLIYTYGHLLGLGPREAVIYAPVLLNPLLILSAYFMVYRASGDRDWASLSALFTATGVKMAVGLYSYFLANMLGLVLIYASLGLLLASMREGDLGSLVFASILASLALFTHPWTLTQYCAAVAILAVYISLRDRSPERCYNILIYLLVVGLVDVLKMALLGGVEVYGAVSSTSIKLLGLMGFWRNSIFTFRILYGGLLSNIMMLCFGILGAYKLDDARPYQSLLTCLLAASSIYYRITSNMIPSRILYNIPLEVLTSLSILSIIKNNGVRREVGWSLILFMMVYSVVYILRSTANLI